MKNKKDNVIDLFGRNDIPQNEGVKYSALLDKYIASFENDFPKDWMFEDVCDFAVNAWNLGNMSTIVPEKEFDQVFSLFPVQELDISLLKKMIAHKVSHFKKYDRFIADFEITDVNGQPTLEVISEERDSFLANMADSLGDRSSPEEFEENCIDRQAIVLKPKQAFFDWFNGLHPDIEPMDMVEASIYLVDDSIEVLEMWLEKKFDKFFTMELSEWHIIEKEWPQKRTFKMFKQWFQVDICSVVYDLEKRPVFKGI